MPTDGGMKTGTEGATEPRSGSPSKRRRLLPILILLFTFLLGIPLGLWIVHREAETPYSLAAQLLSKSGVNDFLHLPAGEKFVPLESLDKTFEDAGVTGSSESQPSEVKLPTTNLLERGGAATDIEMVWMALALLGPSAQETLPCITTQPVDTAVANRRVGLCTETDGSCHWLWRPFSGPLDSEASCISPVEFGGLYLSLLGERGTTPKASYAYFERALQMNDTPSIRFALGTAKVRFGVTDFGAADIEEALLADPSVGGYVALGKALLDDPDRGEDAVVAFNTALNIDSTNLQARMGLVQALLNKGALTGVERHLKWLAKEHPRQAGVNLLWARYWLMKEEPQKALESLQLEAEITPGYESFARFAELTAKLNGFRKAVELLKGKYDESDDPRYLQKAAMLLHDNSEREEGIQLLKEHLRKTPQDATSARLVAGLLLADRQYSASLTYAQSALRAEPESKELNLLVLLDKIILRNEGKGDEQVTKAELTDRLMRFPGIAVPLANQLLDRGYTESTLLVLETAVEVNPRAVDLLANLYAIYIGTNQPTKARQLKENAKQSLSSEDDEALNQLVEQIDKVQKLRSNQGTGQDAHLPDDTSLTGEE